MFWTKFIETTCSCLLAGTALADFPLVRDGRATPIVIPAEAEASTELAARELADYVEKITDIRPQILTNDCGRSPRVEIGTLNTLKGLPEAIVKKFDASSSWESYVVSCGKDVLRIVGRDEVAELYGTYRFMEERLDVRWFKQWTKDDPGDYFPRRATLEIPLGEPFKAPDLSSRWLAETGSSHQGCPSRGIEWTVRLGLQCVDWFGVRYLKQRHLEPGTKEWTRIRFETFKPRLNLRRLHLGGGHMMLAGPIRSKDWFDKHPEYFAEVNGKRVAGDRYCLSNPDVQRLVAEDIIGKLDKMGGKGEYLFGLADGTANICECEKCRALDDAAARANPARDDISTRLHSVARNIAAQVYAKYPDATLFDWAYSLYRKPPVGVTLDPRTGVQMCIHGRCYGHSIDDPHCERNPAMLKWVKDWMKAASWGKTYEYANCSHNYYCPVETIYAHDLAYYHSIGLRGWGEEMNYADSLHVPCLPKGRFDKRKEKTLSNWQWLYSAAKISWDTTLALDAVLDDAESKYYGPAYPAMNECQRLRRTSWKNAPVCWGYGGYPMGDERTRTVLNAPGLKDRLLALLDEAEKLAAGDAVRLYRVGKDREWLQRYWIEPNEKLRKTRSRGLSAPVAESAVTVDGDAADAAWGRACWAEGCAPDRTDVGILSDDGNLYFLFRVLGAKDEMRHDRMGVVLYPPDADNTGRSYTFAADLARCAKGTDAGYTAELKVPADGIRKLVRGEIWHVKFFRNPDGNEPDIRYPLEIGEPKLSNGSFEELDEKGVPKGWDNVVRDQVVALPGNQHAVCVTNYFMHGLSGRRSIGDRPYERQVRVSFRAWGQGKLSVWFNRYLDTPKPNGAFHRQNIQPGLSVGAPVVTAEPKYYSFVVKIPPKEWVSLAFRRAWEKNPKGVILLDDVSVTEE